MTAVENTDGEGNMDDALERPDRPEEGDPRFGSDVIARTLRDLDIPYIALNPGASYRGLHDSLVNFLGNRDPRMLVCLHEEHAVGIAQGYAKVTGRMMAAAVHSNVGLMHASMAIFNAWCDRMPVLVLGATGPVDAARRRPWIDWIHTARDQGALVRNYVKWDDQPASAEAAQESLARAAWIAQTSPRGPVYVNLDSDVQEAKLDAEIPAIDIARYVPIATAGAGKADIAAIADALLEAKRPVLLFGRMSRSPDDWQRRVRLAERLGARVMTDTRIGATFPTDHPLHTSPPAAFASPDQKAEIAASDLVVSFDWVDLAGQLAGLDFDIDGGNAPAKVIGISLDHHLHNGWSMDHQALPAVDRHVGADPDLVVHDLLDALGDGENSAGGRKQRKPAPHQGYRPPAPGTPMVVRDLAMILGQVTDGRDVSLLQVPISWSGAWWHFRHPLDFVGSNGGGGVGGGPGIVVGAALGLRGSGRLPVAFCGDGDFTMGCTAIWTAVHYRIPLLVIVNNNHSFFNDEIHQERMARQRNRPVENKWIGQRIADPEVDISMLARAQGAVAFGQFHTADAYADALRQAIEVVGAGGVAVVDAQIEPGYTDEAKSALGGGSGG